MTLSLRASGPSLEPCTKPLRALMVVLRLPQRRTGVVGGFPALFRLSRSNTMVSILKKRQRGQLTIDYHLMGLFPVSAMVFAKKIEDFDPHRNLRASAVFFPKAPRIRNTFAIGSTVQQESPLFSRSRYLKLAY
jgi:hypothetical protein